VVVVVMVMVMMIMMMTTTMMTTTMMTTTMMTRTMKQLNKKEIYLFSSSGFMIYDSGIDNFTRSIRFNEFSSIISFKCYIIISCILICA